MTPSNSSVLVAYASKHGATRGIAERIGERLRTRGLDVRIGEAGGDLEMTGFRAVVLGSAVYAGHWMGAAKDASDRLASAEPPPEVWLFSSGPIGDPPKPDEDPVDVAEIMRSTQARAHELFAGKLDKSQLGFGERAIVAALRAPEGDFRDWKAIEEFADQIADALDREQPA